MSPLCVLCKANCSSKNDLFNHLQIAHKVTKKNISNYFKVQIETNVSEHNDGQTVTLEDEIEIVTLEDDVSEHNDVQTVTLEDEIETLDDNVVTLDDVTENYTRSKTFKSEFESFIANLDTNNLAQSEKKAAKNKSEKKIKKTKVEKEVFECNECGNVFTAEHNLIRHKISIHQGVKFSCNI